MTQHKWPLMAANFHRNDLDAVIELLRSDDPKLTQGPRVQAFEAAFSEWLGVKHSVFVNSGASANLLTMCALKHKYGPGSVILPAVTWSSDVMSVLWAGLEPRFVDVDRRTLGMSNDGLEKELVKGEPLATFVTHCMGYSAFAAWDNENQVNAGLLIEDVCESLGAKHGSKKLGTFGLASNYSFYYAHHMTTVEGGMVCSDDEEFADTVRMMRGHGMVRESRRDEYKRHMAAAFASLNPEFIFAVPGFNVRADEIRATLGLSQLRRLDENVQKRNENLKVFLDHLDPEAYQTDFATEGASSYALTLVLVHPDRELRDAVEALLKQQGVERRRGVAGGGNQLRQPYLTAFMGRYGRPEDFPVAERLHHYGWYIGNHPDLERVDILWLCEKLNGLVSSKVAV